MKKIEASFTIVTPMFIGDAKQEAHDVRPSSLKGALRFWWRALNWAPIRANAANDAAALLALHREEARLFGIAAGADSGGQGLFLLLIKQNVQAANHGFQGMTAAQLYLLGQGLGTFKGGNQTTRSALVSGEFTASLLFRPGSADADIASVAKALFAFGLLGGLGSRARHGMGSVSLTQWQGAGLEVPSDVAAYRQTIKGLLPEQPTALPPFTAFSSKARLDISASATDPLKLLTVVGGEMQMYRSYGQKGEVAGHPAEQNFAPDHDLVLQATQGKQIDRAPVRSVFGLPHNYFFSSTKSKADINYAPAGKDARRASPLMLHIHRLPDGSCLAVHTLLPATFLPAGARVTVKSKVRSQVSVTPDWDVLHTFLNRFANKETLHG
jgi:CRISPR-associated protein Cmr1